MGVPAFHALLLALDEWVAKGTPPPASAYPTLATQELVSRSAVQFPHIPGVEFPPYLPRNWRMDYGPDFATKGIISQEPPALGAPYTIHPHVSPHLCFLQHSPSRLCYDGVAHTHASSVSGPHIERSCHMVPHGALAALRGVLH